MSRVILGGIAISQTGPFGSQLHEEDYVSEGTPIVTVEHLGDINFTHQNLPFVSEADTKRLSKYILIEGDIVFSRVGSIDRNVYVDKNHEGWMFSGRCIRVRADKNKVNPRYLSYYFKQNSFKKMMMNLAVGATMPSLNTKIMNSIELDLLPRENQDKIANILSAIDDKIQINNQINQELEAMVKTLYDYWFVQFDFPDQNGKPYKSSACKMVFHPELKREIPEGWGVEKLGELIELERGVTYAKSDIVEKTTKDAIGVLRATNITSNVMDLNDLVYLAKDKINNKQIIKQNETLIVMSSGSKEHLGKNAINYYEEVIGFGAFCSKIVPKKYINYINMFLQSSEFKGYLLKQSMGTNINNLTNSDILDCKIILPNNDILDKFENMVEKNIKLISNNYIQNQELTQLRDWLLPMLMNGQVKV